MRIVDRGARVLIIGEEAQASKIDALLGDMLAAVRRGHTPSLADVDGALERIREADGNGGGQWVSESAPALRPELHVRPRTPGQQRYLDMINTHEMCIAIGPAGTGKTYLAMAAAISALLNKRVKRLILTRPAVEAGEKLGFLPGDIAQKVDPYLRPLYDALYSMVDVEQARRFIEQEQIEVAPLAFMRGRTLDQAFAILDEAQNTTTEQMLMFLTRLGRGSKAVITGDITQRDLPKGTKSGLMEARHVLKGIQDIGIAQLDRRDVVRNPLVQRIIDAYEVHHARGGEPDNRPGTNLASQ